MKFRNPLETKAADARIVAKDIPFTPNLVGKPSFTDWQTDVAIKDGFKASSWVYTAVTRLARTAASVAWIAEEKDASGKWVRWNNGDNPIEELFAEPNPWMNGQDWMERKVQHLYLGGNAIDKKVLFKGFPVALFPLMPDQVVPIPDEKLFLKGYNMYRTPEDKSRKKPEELSPDEVLHIMFTDPANMYWGISPLQAVARTVDTDVEAVKWNKISLQNRAITDGVFSIGTPITPAQYNEIRAMVREQHQGANSAHTPWVLGYGSTWQQMSLSPAEMDFLNSRKFNRQEILSVYGVPPPMAGLYEEAQYNNVTTARTIFWVDTIIPLLEDLRVAFQMGIARHFGKNIRITYDLSDIPALQGTPLEKANIAKIYWQMGVPLSVLNEAYDLGIPDDTPGLDVGYIPFSVTPTLSGVTRGEAVEANPELAGRGTPGRKQLEQKLSTPDEREVYWKKQDLKRRKWEQRLTSNLRDQFERDADLIVRTLKSDGIDGLNSISLELRGDWYNLLLPFGTALMQDVSRATYTELVSEKEFSWDSVEYQQFLSDYAALSAGEIVDTTLTNATNFYQLSEADLEAFFEQAEMTFLEQLFGRLTIIVSTEIAKLWPAAQVAGAEQAEMELGEEFLKVWISQRDNKVRESHQAVDGTAIALSEKFNVGGHEMLRPGDNSAPVQEIANCRCVLGFTTASKHGKINRKVRPRRIPWH